MDFGMPKDHLKAAEWHTRQTKKVIADLGQPSLSSDWNPMLVAFNVARLIHINLLGH
jgi:hypothetical protein